MEKLARKYHACRELLWQTLLYFLRVFLQPLLPSGIPGGGRGGQTMASLLYFLNTSGYSFPIMETLEGFGSLDPHLQASATSYHMLWPKRTFSIKLQD